MEEKKRNMKVDKENYWTQTYSLLRLPHRLKVWDGKQNKMNGWGKLTNNYNTEHEIKYQADHSKISVTCKPAFLPVNLLSHRIKGFVFSILHHMLPYFHEVKNEAWPWKLFRPFLTWESAEVLNLRSVLKLHYTNWQCICKQVWT